MPALKASRWLLLAIRVVPRKYMRLFRYERDFFVYSGKNKKRR